MKIRELLQEMVDQNASDIFIVAGLPLTYQVEGRQVRWDAPLMPADTSEVVHAIYGLAGRDINPFLNSFNHDDDYSFAVPGLGRFPRERFPSAWFALGDHSYYSVHASYC